MKELVAHELEAWLASPVRFVELSPESVLFEHFRDPDAHGFNRLRAPTIAHALALASEDWHAVFPLRVFSELEALLTIESSSVGGGYEEELDDVTLVVRQLGSALEIRRLTDERLAAERTQAEQERLTMLGMVAASLAHELKNPLSSMKALAQTVQEELSRETPNSEQAKDLGLIVEQVDRLNGIAREVLDFSRPSPSGDGTAVHGVIESAAYVLDHEARRRGIRIDVSGVTLRSAVPGSPATWQTVVFNLTLNAIRHAPNGSVVTLRLLESEDRVTFECENQGEAIPDEVASRLFEPFVSKATGGTGLGLALVDQRVREMGGTIELDNVPDRILFRVIL